MNNCPKVSWLFFLVLFSVLLLTLLLNVILGSVAIPVGDGLKILFKLPTDNPVYHDIIWQIRLPRVLATLAGGAALAVAGLLLQIFFQNPIVDSFVLGISSGASMFVGMVMLAGVTFGLGEFSSLLIFITAFCGSMLVMFIVLAVAHRVKNVVSLLIIGLMIGYLCSASTIFLTAFAQREQLQTFMFWTLGSFAGFTWSKLMVLSVITIPALLLTFLISKPLNALLLGENYARSLGVNLKQIRLLIVIFSSLLSGVVTAFAGPVAFIGLAVPHLARLIVGTSQNQILIPASLLCGAIITGFCDLLARMLLAPIELPLTAVTSFLGAPVVIWFLVKRRNLC